MNFVRPIAAAALMLCASNASAAIVAGSLTGGTLFTSGGVFELISAPAQTGDHNNQSNNLLAWNEQQGVTLTAPLAANLGLTSIPVGTWISSHGITADPVTGKSLRANITFDKPILAVIYTTADLVASDWLGVGTVYNSPAGRGLEFFDINNTFFNGNVLTFTWSALRPGDNIRVITGVVPEAATWAMMIAGFGMVGASMRRRRSATAAVQH